MILKTFVLMTVIHLIDMFKVYFVSDINNIVYPSISSDIDNKKFYEEMQPFFRQK